jgi:hypothetical protein
MNGWPKPKRLKGFVLLPLQLESGAEPSPRVALLPRIARFNPASLPFRVPEALMQGHEEGVYAGIAVSSSTWQQGLDQELCIFNNSRFPASF